LTEITRISDQKMRERTPRMFWGVTAKPWEGKKDSRTAYSGLVPMSPYTMPSAVRERNARYLPRGAGTSLGVVLPGSVDSTSPMREETAAVAS